MKRCHAKTLRSFLDETGLHAKKGLSQNFLIDENIVRNIIKTAQVSEKDVVIEIGPGPGALTEALLDTGAQIIAIEKDKGFAQALKKIQHSRLTVIEEDILDSDIKALAQGKKVKIVSNLPYHLTSPILGMLLPLQEHIETLTIMVQKEVAERLCAKPGSSDYSSFTLFVSAYTNIKYCFTVQPTCFYPKPKIRSAVIQLTPTAPLPFPPHFFARVRAAFAKKRKMIKVSLKEWYPSDTIEQALRKLDLSPLARPETLDVHKWIPLISSLEN